MSLTNDLKMLYRIAFHPIRGKTHKDRLESFYKEQAEGYDAFRARLLHGRAQMFSRLPFPPGGVWADFGSGTGINLALAGDKARALNHIYLIDLSPSLLAQAAHRIEQNHWTNAQTIEADATTVTLPQVAGRRSRSAEENTENQDFSVTADRDLRPATCDLIDVATFSYSLTMIPDWFAALDRAYELLRPGGTIGIADFYVSRKHADDDMTRHSAGTRNFWRAWFDHDNIYPSPDHLPYLRRKFETVYLFESRGSVPYLPGARIPYYIFIGRKPD